MKRIVFLLFLFVVLLNQHQYIQAEEFVTSVETEDWIVDVYKTDFSTDERMSRCDDRCSSFHVKTTNKKGDKLNIISLFTYGSESSKTGTAKEGGFFRNAKEILSKDEILDDFNNYPVSKNENEFEILFVWEDGSKENNHFKQFKETIKVPIKHYEN